MMIVFHILATILMVTFAIVQHNDPDGTTWVLIYGAVAVISGFAARGRHFPVLTLGLLWLYGGMCLLYLPDLYHFLTNEDGISFAEGMQNTYPYIERSREFGGLLIASGVVAFQRWAAVKRTRG